MPTRLSHRIGRRRTFGTFAKVPIWYAAAFRSIRRNMLGCPILFIPGGQDIVIPPFAARAMAAELPNAQVAPIPAAGHSGYFEHAAAFNALVEAFLDGIE